MALETEQHDVTVIRTDGDDEVETLIKCIVEVTLEGSKWSGWRLAGVDWAECGQLPDGTPTDLRPDEVEQLEDAAGDIRIKARNDAEEAELNRLGGDY